MNVCEGNNGSVTSTTYYYVLDKIRYKQKEHQWNGIGIVRMPTLIYRNYSRPNNDLNQLDNSIKFLLPLLKFESLLLIATIVLLNSPPVIKTSYLFSKNS